MTATPNPLRVECPTCAGTGWVCDVHGVGHPGDYCDQSWSGCPQCTPPGKCGGTGEVDVEGGA